MDGIMGMAGSNTGHSRSTRINKLQNYRVVNSQFNVEDYIQIIDPYGFSGKFSDSVAKMDMYNIIRPKFETLKGEELAMPLNHVAKALDGEAVSQKRTLRNDAIAQSIRSHALQEAGLESPENPPQDPEAINKYFKKKYVNAEELAANQLLKLFNRKLHLKSVYSKGWEHAMVAAEEIYYTGIHKGHPVVRACNPLNVDFERDMDSAWIKDSAWVREKRKMTVGSVIDTYGEFLSDNDVRDLEEGYTKNGAMANSSYKARFAQPDWQNNDQWKFADTSDEATSVGQVDVSTLCWKSWKKVGYVKFFDPRLNSWEEFEVGDTYRLSAEMKDAGATLTWEWDIEIWMGTRIGNDLDINVHAMENQNGKLPFVGYVYNSLNSRATSMVDLVKQHQFTYNVTWWRMMEELSKAKGKKFIMDMAQLPKSQGFDVEQWMYHFEQVGVIWINSKEQGVEGDAATESSFNQFNSVDLTLSQVVMQYMTILTKIEDMVEQILGVSQQRVGDIGKSETASGIQRSILQSHNVTRPYFYYHDKVKEEVYTNLLDLASVAYQDGIELEDILDELTTETIKVNGPKFSASTYGVFVTNSIEDKEKIEKLERVLDQAVQQDRATLGDYLSALNTDSFTYTAATIRDSEDKRLQQAQANGEAEREAANKMLEANAIKEQEKLNAEIVIKQAEIDKDIYLGELRAETDLAISKDTIGAAREGKAIDAEIKNKDIDVKERLGKLKATQTKPTTS